MRRLPLAALCAALGITGCQPYGNANMFPGIDCIECHSAQTSTIPGACPATAGQNTPCNASGLTWTTAGTVFSDIDSDPDGGGVPDVHILLQDALGKRVNLTSNSVGNFFTAEPLEFNPIVFEDGGSLPFTVQIEYQGACLQMNLHPTPSYEYVTTHGAGGLGCNACHEEHEADGGPNSLSPTAFLPPGRLAIPQAPKLAGALPGLACPYPDGGACANPDPCDGGFWGVVSDLP